MFTGETILQIADSRLGERYILGAHVPISDPSFHGPWDCSKFVSWCVYQAYNILMGVQPPDAQNGTAYTGYWFQDAVQRHATIDVAAAIATTGALLLRRPRTEVGSNIAIGHIAISRGDGSTVEARGAKYGVLNVPNASQRVWDLGILVPGIQYDHAVASAYNVSSDYLRLTSPYIRGGQVVALQLALQAHGSSFGPIDGVFGRRTETAIVNFQALNGLATDGVVGPDTAKDLGLSWPVSATTKDDAVFAGSLQKDSDRVAEIASVAFAAPDARPSSAAAPETESNGRSLKTDLQAKDIVGYETQPTSNPDKPLHFAKLSDGNKILLGNETDYKDDMQRRGLFQASSTLVQIKDAGIYDRVVFAQTHGLIAHVIWPTALAESSGYFARLNSYDRAAFTYGFFQAAAHTPEQNLIILFRKLLALPNSQVFFPDLGLISDGKIERVHRLLADGTKMSLETVEQVRRPNGKVEPQLTAFMRYLNADPTAVDDAERQAAARLFLWSRADPSAQAAQVEHAIDTVVSHIKESRPKLSGFDLNNWEQVIWINDILHQGRGTFAQMAAALSSAHPVDELSLIGAANFPDRIATIKNAIARLKSEGSLNSWTSSDIPL